MQSIVIIYFFYGLAFFSMGLLVAMEGGRSADERVRKALRPLAGFGFVHALHEWLEMFNQIAYGSRGLASPFSQALLLSLLSFSFVSLAAFGSFLLAKGEAAQRISLLVPLGLEAVWVFGLIAIKGTAASADVFAAAQVWTRYSLGIPASLLAAAGLIAQQRAFRRAGLIRFGRDALWAAVAFAWYGIIGQLFVNPSVLFPSTLLNQDLFLHLFNFPIELLRAILAFVASLYVIRFLRAFQFEADQKIEALKAEQLHESQQRETMRGELFRRVVAAQEAERQRIARDLHHETGQSLTAIGLGLRGPESRLTGDVTKAATTLHELQALTADSLLELQRLMADLRPSHLDDLGLSAALRWYVGKVQERNPLKISVAISGVEQTIDDAAKIATFRIIQEALNNVIKHASAANVDIELGFIDQGIRVIAKDDGRGFDLARVKVMQSGSRPSLGLEGMKERAVLLGGSVSVQSEPGKGTMVEAFIPYHHEREAQNDNQSAAGG